MKKRGFSHIEFILSTLIFISAVWFAIYYFNPYSTSDLTDSSLNYLYYQIQDNSTVSLQSYTLILNDTDGQITQKGISSLSINLSGDVNENTNFEVVNLSGEILDSSTVSLNKDLNSQYSLCIQLNNGPGIQGAQWSWGQSKNAVQPSRLMYIRLSPWLPKNNLGSGNTCPAIDNNLYQLSSFYNLSLLSETEIRGLNSSYYSDYDSLKKQLGIPNIQDFSFSLIFSPDDSIIARRNISSTSEVLSKNSRLEVLRDSGNISFADFSLKIWH